MSKVCKGLCLFVLVSSAYAYASGGIYSIDSSRILRESKEGRYVLSVNEQDKKKLMEFEFEQSKKVTVLRDEIDAGMRAGRFTNNMVQDKYEELGRLQRKAKHLIEDEREDYGLREKKRVFTFRQKVHEVAGEIFKKESGDIVFDRATPGIIYVSEESDRTDLLLKELNKRYEQEKATLMLTKNTKTGSENKKA